MEAGTEEIERETEKGAKARRIESYQAKKQQSKVYSEQEKECHVWLTQNLNPRKTATIMTMLEQMIETRSWKQTRGLMEDGRCRVCFQHSETVEHLVAGCQKLANSEYLSRHSYRQCHNGRGEIKAKEFSGGVLRLSEGIRHGAT